MLPDGLNTDPGIRLHVRLSVRLSGYKVFVALAVLVALLCVQQDRPPLLVSLLLLLSPSLLLLMLMVTDERPFC